MLANDVYRDRVILVARRLKREEYARRLERGSVTVRNKNRGVSPEVSLAGLAKKAGRNGGQNKFTRKFMKRGKSPSMRKIKESSNTCYAFA